MCSFYRHAGGIVNSLSAGIVVVAGFATPDFVNLLNQGTSLVDVTPEHLDPHATTTGVAPTSAVPREDNVFAEIRPATRRHTGPLIWKCHFAGGDSWAG